jgi:hypothetical protein
LDDIKLSICSTDIGLVLYDAESDSAAVSVTHSREALTVSNSRIRCAHVDAIGIEAQHCQKVSVENCTLSVKADDLDRKLSTTQAVVLKEVKVATVRGCQLSGFRMGVSSCDSQLLELSDTTVAECSVGVWLKKEEEEAEQLKVNWSDCRVANSFYGALVESSQCELTARKISFFNVLRKLLKLKVRKSTQRYIVEAKSSVCWSFLGKLDRYHI